MYVNTRTHACIGNFDTIRRENPHISFPATGPDAETLSTLGYAEVMATDPPAITATQRLEEAAPELVDGVWRQAWTVVDLSAEEVVVAVAAAKAAAVGRIDTMAEELRGTVLTPGSGQMAAYQAKEAQASALLQDAAPTEGNYPDIYNEVGITADTAAGVAMAVLAAAETWRLFGRGVEKVRLSGKKAVESATDVAGVAAAEAALVWPESRYASA